MLEIDQPENDVLSVLKSSLRRVSSMPYNTATIVYDAARHDVDVNYFGGSCLDKLKVLKDILSREVLDYSPDLVSVVKGYNNSGSDHYAMLFQHENGTYYLDPFLWQESPVLLKGHTIVNCVINNTQVDINYSGSVDDLEVKLITQIKGGNGTGDVPMTLISYANFERLAELPEPTQILPCPENPSFSVQAISTNGARTYGCWYVKANRSPGFNTINVKEHNLGRMCTQYRNPREKDPSRQEEWANIVAQFEQETGLSYDMLASYCWNAAKLEGGMG